MRQVPSDKYNIAWFKLADFVSRGEKERALGLYRLLTHSFDDQALAYQLEGDLLLSFNDGLAHDRYLMAAQTYQQADRFIEAISMYEQLLLLSPKNEEYALILLSLYAQLNIPSRLVYHLLLILETTISKREYDRMHEIMHQYEAELSLAYKATCYQKIVMLLAKQKGSMHYGMIYLKKVIDVLRFSQEDRLPLFLTELESLDAELYDEAFNYMDH